MNKELWTMNPMDNYTASDWKNLEEQAKLEDLIKQHEYLAADVLRNLGWEVS